MINDNQPQVTITIPKRLYALLVGILLIVAVQGVLLWHLAAPTLFPPKEVTKEDVQAMLDAPQPLTTDTLRGIVQTYCALTPYQIEGESLQPAFMDRSRQVFYTGDRCPLPAIVRPGAVVLLQTGAVSKLVAKFVRAVPGDAIALDPRPGRISVLTVNGRDVLNSVGKPYKVARDRQGLLDLYIRDYGGRIPENSYLLMGDQIEGALDATQFGLVNIADIQGVMRMDNEPWAVAVVDQEEEIVTPPVSVNEEDMMIDDEEPPVVQMISPVDVEASETPVVEEIEAEAGDIVTQTEEEDDVMDDDGDNAPEEIDSESELLIEE